MKVFACLLTLAVFVIACSKDDKAQGGATASPAEAGVVSTAASAQADAAAAKAAAKTGEAASFKGSYTAKPATLYIPEHKDYGSVKQAKSDDTKLVGEGTLTIDVAPDGKVTGTIDSGPASPAVIDATKDGDEIRGTVRRKDPADQGLTGVVLAKVEGGKLTGTLTLAEANAAVLRDATFTAEKK